MKTATINIWTWRLLVLSEKRILPSVACKFYCRVLWLGYFFGEPCVVVSWFFFLWPLVRRLLLSLVWKLKIYLPGLKELSRRGWGRSQHLDIEYQLFHILSPVSQPYPCFDPHPWWQDSDFGSAREIWKVKEKKLLLLLHMADVSVGLMGTSVMGGAGIIGAVSCDVCCVLISWTRVVVSLTLALTTLPVILSLYFPVLNLFLPEIPRIVGIF